jgi:hypothetical protein
VIDTTEAEEVTFWWRWSTVRPNRRTGHEHRAESRRQHASQLRVSSGSSHRGSTTCRARSGAVEKIVSGISATDIPAAACGRGGRVHNLNAGDPAAWLYQPDTSRLEYRSHVRERRPAADVAGGARHKIGVFWDEQTLPRARRDARAVEPGRISGSGRRPRPPAAFARRRRGRRRSPASCSKQASAARSSASATSSASRLDARSDSRRRAVRRRMRRRWHPGSRVSVAGLQPRTGSYLWKGSGTYLTGGHA